MTGVRLYSERRKLCTQLHRSNEQGVTEENTKLRGSSALDRANCEGRGWSKERTSPPKMIMRLLMWCGARAAVPWFCIASDIVWAWTRKGGMHGVGVQILVQGPG
jgi:hypothetical protein